MLRDADDAPKNAVNHSAQSQLSKGALDRRTLLRSGAMAAGGLAVGSFVANSLAHAEDSKPAASSNAASSNAPPARTVFQPACITSVFGAFSLDRGLQGVKNAGYKYVAWGWSQTVNGKRTSVLANDAPESEAKDLGKKCRDLGLEPLMMFSNIYPENAKGLEILTQRLKQAAAGGCPQVLTFGHTKGGNKALWIERFKKLGPIAKDLGVMLVVKQHGGETGTGEACAEITREVNHPNVKVNYDAGNVMDYLDVDPIPDIKKCADEVYSFCIKDHRNWPKDQDCGPGFGEIDHYKLLHAVSFLGRNMPLCCENIFPPVLATPTTAEGIEDYARRARLFLETVSEGVLKVEK